MLDSLNAFDARSAASAETIDLGRTMAPTPLAFSQFLRNGISNLVLENDLSTLVRHHRFLGTDTDKLLGARWLAPRLGDSVPLDRLLVTGGTQSALLVLLGTLLKPGDLVLTELLTYPAVRPLTNLLGLKLDGVEIDSDGILPDALEDCCRRLAPALLFTSPTVQNPTTSIMPAARRAEIAAITRKHNVLIVEDDVQALLVDDPPPPISTYAPEISWYVMSLAKSISIGLRVAYLVGPDAGSVSSLRSNLRSVSSWFVSPLSAALVQTWMQDGSAHKILTEVKNESRVRQRLASEILRDFEFETKPCALHLWMPLPAGWSSEAFGEHSEALGVHVQTSRLFTLPGNQPPASIRVSLGRPLEHGTLSRALEILAGLLRTARPASG